MIVSQTRDEGIAEPLPKHVRNGLQTFVSLIHTAVDVQKFEIHQVQIQDRIIGKFQSLCSSDHPCHIAAEFISSVKTGDRIQIRSRHLKISGDNEHIKNVPFLRIGHIGPVILDQTDISFLCTDIKNNMAGTVLRAGNLQFDVLLHRTYLCRIHDPVEAVADKFHKLLIISAFKKAHHILVRKQKLMPFRCTIGKCPTGHPLRKLFSQIVTDSLLIHNEPPLTFVTYTHSAHHHSPYVYPCSITPGRIHIP